jgi:hypothetical protein
MVKGRQFIINTKPAGRLIEDKLKYIFRKTAPPV